MKKALSLILASILLLSLCACSGNSTKSSAKNNSDMQSNAEDENGKEPAEAQSQDSEPTLSTPYTIPESVTYSGSGDDVVTLEPFENVFVFHIIGNQEEHHFSVNGYDSNSESTGLLVNTTEAYEGTTIDPSQETVMLEVNAEGDWSIEVQSIFGMETISSGETVSGSGDSVILVSSHGNTAKISGNADKRHFAVKSYGTERDKLLVNTTDEYDGTVMLIGEPIILEINAVGNWSISFD